MEPAKITLFGDKFEPCPRQADRARELGPLPGPRLIDHRRLRRATVAGAKRERASQQMTATPQPDEYRTGGVLRSTILGTLPEEVTGDREAADWFLGGTGIRIIARR